MTKTLSLGTVWEETVAFFRTEIALLLPIAFLGFGLPLVAMQLAMPDKIVIGDHLVGGAWMLGMIPFTLFSMTATLAISALALHPGMSVRESLLLALKRLPSGIGIALLCLATLFALTIVVSILGAVEAGVTGRSGPVLIVAVILMLAALISLLVRILPVWAVLALAPQRPMAALRRAFVATRPYYLRLLLLRIVAWTSQSLIAVVALMPVVVIFRLVGRATGAPTIAEVLALVVGGMVTATLAALWTVYVARLYRVLASSNGI